MSTKMARDVEWAVRDTLNQYSRTRASSTTGTRPWASRRRRTSTTATLWPVSYALKKWSPMASAELALASAVASAISFHGPAGFALADSQAPFSRSVAVDSSRA